MERILAFLKLDVLFKVDVNLAAKTIQFFFKIWTVGKN